MGGDELRTAVLRNIPMDYLRRHDVPGATGPTEACNIAAALNDYAEDRWKLIERLSGLKRENETLLTAVREMRSRLDATTHELEAVVRLIVNDATRDELARIAAEARDTLTKYAELGE